MSAPSITAKDFDEKVLQAKEPVLVDTWYWISGQAGVDLARCFLPS